MLKISIQFEPGSKFQEETAWENLKIMINSWKSFYELQHKKNKIKITESKNKQSSSE